MCQSNDELFATLAKAAQRLVGELNAQGLANTAWAFATLNMDQWDEMLFAPLARASEQQMHIFFPKELANSMGIRDGGPVW